MQWDCYILEAPNSATTELVMDILKYGAEVDVIAPDSLRLEIAERLSKAAQVYL